MKLFSLQQLSQNQYRTVTYLCLLDRNLNTIIVTLTPILLLPIAGLFGSAFGFGAGLGADLDAAYVSEICWLLELEVT